MGKQQGKRPASNVKYGSRASRGKRPTSAQARQSGSNIRKKAAKGGTTRTVGSRVMSTESYFKPNAGNTSKVKPGKMGQ